MSKRLNGLNAGVEARVRTLVDEWPDIQAPSHYSLGPGALGITYLPRIVIAIPLGAGGSSAQSFSVQSPFDVPSFIESAILDIRAPGQSSAAINIGIVASSGTAGSNIMSSGDLGTARILPLVAGFSDKKWGAKGASSDAWITGKIIQDGASSLAGDLIITVIPLYST